MVLTMDEKTVLHELMLRPGGVPFRSDDLQEAVLSLAHKRLVCDPHRMGNALFTRITEEGREAFRRQL